MSLINEALKQARAAQAAAPASESPLALRPADESAPVRRRWLLVIPIALGITAVAGGVVLWWAAYQSQLAANFPPIGENISVRARSAQTPPATAPVVSKAPTVATLPPPTPVPPPAAQPKPVGPAATVATQPVPSPSPAPTAATATVAPAPVPPAPALKLQGIVIHPTRPSVMINGRVLFLGDRIAELTVSEIKVNQVTLTGTGGPQVLRMAE